jgi:hypothetical protein
MYELPNRKQRRNMMKQLGLLKQKSGMSFEKWSAQTSKNIEMGKEMHRQKTEEMLRRNDEAEAAKIVSETVETIETEENKQTA